MSKAKATVAEQALHNAMRGLGCYVATSPGQGHKLPRMMQSLKDECFYAHPEIHHINADGMKRKEWAVIPLCSWHHRLLKVSIHGSKTLFRYTWGDEWKIFFRELNRVINDLKPEHRTEILQKIDDYKESGHASVQFLQAYDKGRVGG